MNTSLISPKMLDGLAAFYPSTVTIQQPTTTQSATGAPVQTWGDVAGLVDLPCTIAPVTDIEQRLAGSSEPMTPEIATHHLTLKGHYSGITPRMRAVSDGATYDVTGAESDSHATMTRLWLRVVTV